MIFRSDDPGRDFDRWDAIRRKALHGVEQIQRIW